MSIRTFFTALGSAALTAATLTALTVPLARRIGIETPDVSAAERVTGFTMTTVVVLTILHTPVLIVLARVVRLRLARAWVSIGSTVLLFIAFMLLPIMQTRSFMPVVWNLQGWIERPADFAADKLPVFAAALVFGALAWVPTRRAP